MIIITTTYSSYDVYKLCHVEFTSWCETMQRSPPSYTVFSTNNSSDMHVFFWLYRYTVIPCPLIQHLCSICICHNLSYVAIRQLSPPWQINHISQSRNPGSSQAGNRISIPSFADSRSLNGNASTDQQYKDPSVVHNGAALPPIFIKLLKQLYRDGRVVTSKPWTPCLRWWPPWIQAQETKHFE